jgi:hypothetical protein
MNITLSADERVIKKSREYARRHNTSLNQLIRDYLKRVASMEEGPTPGEEFVSIARDYAGESAPDYRFDRDELHRRKQQ